MKDGHIIIKDNFDGPGLGIELDENLIENERGVPEWEFPEMLWFFVKKYIVRNH